MYIPLLGTRLLERVDARMGAVKPCICVNSHRMTLARPYLYLKYELQRCVSTADENEEREC